MRDGEMVNEGYVLTTVKPLLNEKKQLLKEDFKKLFSHLKNDELKDTTFELLQERTCYKRNLKRVAKSTWIWKSPGTFFCPMGT